MSIPSTLTINAWTGAAAADGALGGRAAKWGSRPGLPTSQETLPFERAADPTDWADENVGYGVLLPDGLDVPGPVQRLLDSRPGTVVLRWNKALKDRMIRRVRADGKAQDLAIGLTTFGTAEGNKLPRYVLIAAPPNQIPWSVQYALSVHHSVGRLPLSGDALGPYIDAMLSNWSANAVDVMSPLLWTVDHGPTDITRLMRQAITAPLEKALTGTLPGLRHLTATQSTGANLCEELSKSPALVVTSSHGSTPIGDGALLQRSLGLPVDVAHQILSLDDLEAAMPAGALWFAQACCSAGGAGQSTYDGLLQPESSAARVLAEVARLGPLISPAAATLLSREEPVRGILGHVEPTFDWTLRIEQTGQLLGGNLVRALSTNIHSGQPLGFAFEDYRQGVGVLHTEWANLHGRLANGDTSVREELTRLRLTAIDRQSLVLLGDPTVTMPALRID